jgi:hypothetical protein
MTTHDPSCVFSRAPQRYDVRYPTGTHFTVEGVLTFIHLGPSRQYLLAVKGGMDPRQWAQPHPVEWERLVEIAPLKRRDAQPT